MNPSLTPEIRDIAGPVAFAPSYTFIIMALALLCLIASAIVFYYLKKRRNKPAAEQPKLSPWAIAFEQLNRLKTQGLLDQGDFDGYYSRLSDIVRRYIEERFHIKTPEMTTEEFLMSLKRSNQLSDAQKQLLKQFLESCDMVKFAKYLPAVSEGHKSFDLAKELVKDTTVET